LDKERPQTSGAGAGEPKPTALERIPGGQNNATGT